MYNWVTFCTPEINTALLINCTLAQNKSKKTKVAVDTSNNGIISNICWLIKSQRKWLKIICFGF